MANRWDNVTMDIKAGVGWGKGLIGKNQPTCANDKQLIIKCQVK